MERLKLLAAVEAVAPALSNNDLIPILSHIWFTGTKVMAFNDKIAISVPLKTEFTGAVPPTLIDLLKNSRAKEIEFIAGEEGALKIKAASSKLSMSSLPASDFIFEMPKAKDDHFVSGDAVGPFLAAIQCCMRSIGSEASVPEQLGITLIPTKNEIMRLFSTNNATLSHAKTKGKIKLAKRVILSSEFCRQVLTIAKQADKVTLHLGDDFALMTADNVQLYGRLLRSEHPLDFDGILTRHFPDFEKKTADDTMYEVPSKFKLILERSVIIANSKMEPAKMAVTVKDGRATFKTASDRGEIVDSMQVGEAQANVSVRFDPMNLKIGYEGGEKMRITERCVVLCKDDSFFMVAASGD